MDHISPFIHSVLRDHGLERGIADYRVFTLWPEIVGQPLAQWTRPLRVVDDTLWIHVGNSTLLHHLAYLAPRLCTKLRESAPESSIRRVRFTLRERES